MRKFLQLTAAVVTLFTSLSLSAKPITYYFPQQADFDQSIPTPDEYLGYGVGDWHVRHDQLNSYMELLAQKSDRITIETTGYTHERRQLKLMTITSPDNHGQLETIRQQHLNRISQKGIQSVDKAPLVLWMGYSVHGNESSGSNASMLVAYYLAASNDAFVGQLLNNSVVLLDPSINPDGLDRFATWANSNRGMTLSTDPETMEHAQAWPYARTNHYWFDLNRDWLLLQHPESRARIAKFHHWMPNVLTDFHEMGTNSTYFFQPGVPSRKNPITPDKNVDLTKAIAEFHAKALDADDQLYFTEEAFDDFYYGKGSTYPDVHGAVGILFEQASSRGHAQDSINGLLTFSETIKNQLTTSMSTFKGSLSVKDDLLKYQQSFYDSALELGSDDDVKGYLLHEAHDKSRLDNLVNLLRMHKIKVLPVTKDFKASKKKIAAGTAYFVPSEQAQHRLVKAVFSTRKSFPDNTFYDISGWTLPYAFNIDFMSLKSTRGLTTGKAIDEDVTPAPELANSYAYAMSWDDYMAPSMLQQMLDNGLMVRVATEGFKAKVAGGEQQFKPGTILIPRGIQKNADWLNVLRRLNSEVKPLITALESGLTSSGIDLGSRSFEPVEKPKVILVGGEGVSPYEVGEIWYYFDRFLGLAPTMIEKSRLNRVDLNNYTHIVFANGRYNELNDSFAKKLKSWISAGGVVWGQKGGAEWLADRGIAKADYVSAKEMRALFPTDGLSYGDRSSLASRQRIAGAIFGGKIDLTHPLAYGYNAENLPLFKDSTGSFKRPDTPFVSVINYVEKPLMSGYSDDINVEKIAEGTALVAHNMGQGRVIAMADNVNFRGFWYGTSRLLSNAIYFGHVFSASAD